MFIQDGLITSSENLHLHKTNKKNGNNSHNQHFQDSGNQSKTSYSNKKLVWYCHKNRHCWRGRAAAGERGPGYASGAGGGGRGPKPEAGRAPPESERPEESAPGLGRPSGGGPRVRRALYGEPARWGPWVRVRTPRGIPGGREGSA